jgi:hypothetical protein
VLRWEELFVVHEEEHVCWYLLNLGSCLVAPLEVCTWILMVTGYGYVCWEPGGNRVVVEMPRAWGVLVHASDLTQISTSLLGLSFVRC